MEESEEAVGMYSVHLGVQSWDLFFGNLRRLARLHHDTYHIGVIIAGFRLIHGKPDTVSRLFSAGSIKNVEGTWRYLLRACSLSLSILRACSLSLSTVLVVRVLVLTRLWVSIERLCVTLCGRLPYLTSSTKMGMVVDVTRTISDVKPSRNDLCNTSRVDRRNTCEPGGSTSFIIYII